MKLGLQLAGWPLRCWRRRGVRLPGRARGALQEEPNGRDDWHRRPPEAAIQWNKDHGHGHQQQSPRTVQNCSGKIQI